MNQPIDVSAVIPAWNEAGNIGPLVTRISDTLCELGLSFEVIIVDGGSKDATQAEAAAAGAQVLLQKRPGYGGALREGFMAARGQWVVTMDADLSHPPELIKDLWAKRDAADIVVASRFIAGGKSEAPTTRQLLSKFLNKVFASLLSLPVNDSSSGYRLYKRKILRPEEYIFENFNVLQEILITAYCDGFSVGEVPLHYGPRGAGESHVSFVKFAISYLPTLYKMWVLRHSLDAADYESRAYSSRHLLQRFWQRRRTEILRELTANRRDIIDVGSGSGKFTQSLTGGMAIDTAREKLRFLKRFRGGLVNASAAALPLKDASVECLVCSQTLPYLDAPMRALDEFQRVLKKDGLLVVGVPDSSTTSWKLIGFVYNRLLPNIFLHRHRAAFTKRMLVDELAQRGFRITKTRYILGAELIIQAVKVE